MITAQSGRCAQLAILFITSLERAHEVAELVFLLSSTLFFEEFSTLSEQLAVAPANLLIVGDFNFHVDNLGNTDAIKFTCILESFNLKQHVQGHTHKKGHTLDLLITRADDDLVTSIEVRDPRPMLFDHLAVHCKLRLQKPPLERASIQYRKIHSIDMDSFNDDLKSLHSCHVTISSCHPY